MEIILNETNFKEIKQKLEELNNIYNDTNELKKIIITNKLINLDERFTNKLKSIPEIFTKAIKSIDEEILDLNETLNEKYMEIQLKELLTICQKYKDDINNLKDDINRLSNLIYKIYIIQSTLIFIQKEINYGLLNLEPLQNYIEKNQILYTENSYLSNDKLLYKKFISLITDKDDKENILPNYNEFINQLCASINTEIQNIDDDYCNKIKTLLHKLFTDNTIYTNTLANRKKLRELFFENYFKKKEIKLGKTKPYGKFYIIIYHLIDMYI